MPDLRDLLRTNLHCNLALSFAPGDWMCHQPYSPAQCIELFDAGQLAVPADDDSKVAAKLFASFAMDEREFPLYCSAPALQRMLSQPPAASVPASQAQIARCRSKWVDHQHPLFVLERETSATDVSAMLYTALCQAWPRGQSSELLLTGFWNNIAMNFPEIVGQLLGLDIVIDRWVVLFNDHTIRLRLV